MTNLIVKYRELFNLSLEQLFYENSFCRKYAITPELDFDILPTEECKAIMKRMGFLYKKLVHRGGFSLWTEITESGGNNLLRYKVKSSDKLTFAIVIRNPELVNFNDLPTSPVSDSIYYLSNKIVDAAASRENLHLSIDPLTVSTADQTILTKSSFNYIHGSHVSIGTAKVKHILSGQEILPKSLLNEAGSAYLSFDLSSLPSGKCQLIISGTMVSEVYYSADFQLKTVFGFIELSLDSALEANYRIVEPDNSLTLLRPSYKITFKNRETRWRYILVLKNNSPLFLEMAALSPAEKVDFINQLNIVANDTTISFSKNAISDTRFEFVSDSELSLKERYFSSTSMVNEVLNLTLKKYIGNPLKEAAVKANLPYPGTYGIDALNDPTIYSDILLTL